MTSGSNITHRFHALLHQKRAGVAEAHIDPLVATLVLYVNIPEDGNRNRAAMSQYWIRPGAAA